MRIVDLLFGVAALLGVATARLYPLHHTAHAHHAQTVQPAQHRRHHVAVWPHEHDKLRILYQGGRSEEGLPECAERAVCSRVDLYQSPWVERQCRCPWPSAPCPGVDAEPDGRTLLDKTRQLKLCEPVKELPRCRYFRDVTWTLVAAPDNTTQQVVHCRCPREAVAYLIKRTPADTPSGRGFEYRFACSPQSRLRCARKEPCRLFTVRRRAELVDEVNTNTLCRCPADFRCPAHHTDARAVVQGRSYREEAIHTFSGFCAPD